MGFGWRLLLVPMVVRFRWKRWRTVEAAIDMAALEVAFILPFFLLGGINGWQQEDLCMECWRSRKPYLVQRKARYHLMQSRNDTRVRSSVHSWNLRGRALTKEKVSQLRKYWILFTRNLCKETSITILFIQIRIIMFLIKLWFFISKGIWLKLENKS